VHPLRNERLAPEIFEKKEGREKGEVKIPDPF
jgi:hypothetical protein